MATKSASRRLLGWGQLAIFVIAFGVSAIGSSLLEHEQHIWDKFLVVAGIGDFPAMKEDYLTQFREDFSPRPARIKCPRQTARTMVAVVLGQSNAANYAQVRTEAHDPRVTVFYRGACYEARDPLLGASGSRGSVWPMFAHRVIASGRYDNLVLVPAAIGGTSMESWSPGGVYYDRIESRLERLAHAGLRPTHFLISQGELEADSGQDGRSYQGFAERLLRELNGTGAQVFLATTGRCIRRPNPAIRAAQERARRATGSFAGPDMDAIGPKHRVNGCHLDAAGAKTVAAG
ncbi:MAG TPA: sialate O-acetylesterase, partial [Sphingomonas sp.]|nr:sialate O-acetylesterase [Sphingomonas sp.]